MQAYQSITATDLLRATLNQIIRYSGRILPMMGLIWLLQMPSFLSGRLFLPLDAMETLGLPPGPISLVAGIVVMLATYVGPTWCAVGWHRLVLLGEESARHFPMWQTRPILAYFIVSLFLPLVTLGLPALIVAAMAAVIYALGAPTLLIAIPAIPATVVAVWLSLRLAPVQVSRALDDQISIRDAYTSTAPLARPLWGCAIIGTLFVGLLFGITVATNALLMTPEGFYRSGTAMYLDAIIFNVAYFLFFIVAISGFNTVYLLPDTGHNEAEVFS